MWVRGLVGWLVGYRHFICAYLFLSKINGNRKIEVWLNEHTTVDTKVQYL
jgi:hypothetical protein